MSAENEAFFLQTRQVSPNARRRGSDLVDELLNRNVSGTEQSLHDAVSTQICLSGHDSFLSVTQPIESKMDIFLEEHLNVLYFDCIGAK